MISEQKLLQWIEDKRYVYAVLGYDPKGSEDSPEEIAYDKGRLNALSLLEMAVNAGEFDLVANEDKPKFYMDGEGQLIRIRE